MAEHSEKITETIIEKKDLELEKDWFLQSLVTMANISESKSLFGITLLTHGFLVSGQLVSGREYFKGFAENVASVIDDSEIAKSVTDSFINMGNKVYDKLDNDNNPPPPTFIHLSNAKYFHTNGQPIPANEGIMWRGRLSEVSGFSLGVLSTPNKTN